MVCCEKCNCFSRLFYTSSQGRYNLQCFLCSVYLILGLIVMLVVLETFCELQQLKQLRKMFYLKKEKPQDHLVILEHDHLSFTTVPESVLGPRDGKSHQFVSVPTLASPNDDPMIQ